MWLTCAVAHFAAWRARRLMWSPIGQRVFLDVSASRDAALIGRTLGGVIRATSPDSAGIDVKAVIELDTRLRYFGHYRRDGIASVRTAPNRRWHVLDRLLITSISVDVIDCDAAGDHSIDPVIGSGTMYLPRRGRR